MDSSIAMEQKFADVSIKGEIHKLPCAVVGPHTIASQGDWLRMAFIHDEHWLPATVEDPSTLVKGLKAQGLRADILTFAQKLPETEPKFDLPMEWENLAVIPLTTFDNWWENLPQETRKNVRRAERRGVVTKVLTFDDSLVAGLKRIYDETPIRQGRYFWHYDKELETVKRENATYSDTCEWIGAFHDEALIGALKMVYVGRTATIMQIISENKHYDKRPANALLATAVKTCIDKGLKHFVYGQFVYGKNVDGPLTVFKRRNGFEQVLLPRYYVPITFKGKLAMALKLHLGLRRFLPRNIETALQSWRLKMLKKKASITPPNAGVA